MNKRILSVITVLASVATVVVVASSAADPVIVTGGLCQPSVTVQPTNQLVEVGADTTFSATKGFGWTYQWLRNGTVMRGQTDSTLHLVNAQTDEAGVYSCNVDTGFGNVTNVPANLQVFVVVDVDPDIVVYALPLCSGGGAGTCPGAYKGYVNYYPPTGWGWVPATNTTLFTATDTNRTNTKIEYEGEYGDIGCADTSVTVPYPLYSPQYGFTIFFNSDVPTNTYPITLIGFNP